MLLVRVEDLFWHKAYYAKILNYSRGWRFPSLKDGFRDFLELFVHESNPPSPLIHNPPTPKLFQIWLSIYQIIILSSAFRAMGRRLNQLWGFGPQRRMWLSAMGHCAGSCPALWAIVQNQLWARYELDPKCIHWQCIHIHVVMYTHACGLVSTCMWSCIHMHLVMYPDAFGHVSTCIWSWIHMRVVMYPHACGCVSSAL